MKTALILQDTYTPDIHYKTYAASYIAFLLRKNGFRAYTLDRFGHFSYDELDQLASRYKNIDYLGISAAWMFKAISNRLNVSDVDYNTPKIAKLHHFIKQVNPGKVVVGGNAIELPLGNARYVNGKNEEDIFKAFDILVPKYRSDIQTLEHRYTNDDFILPRETLPLEISRGCIFNCKFCSFSLRGRDKFDYNRDPKLIGDQIEYNRDKFGSTNYYITCDTFNDTTSKIEGIANMLSKRNLKISFVCYLRHDLLHAFPEQIPILRDMGLRGAQFGLETFNHQSGKAIGKGMHPDKVKELLFKLQKEWPLTRLMSIFIVGLPHSTLDEHHATVEWIKSNDTLSFAMFYPLFLNPNKEYGSEFANNADKYGYELNLDASWKYKDLFTFDDVTKKATELNKEMNGNSLSGGIWNEMAYLRDNSWESIMAGTHKKSVYFDEYKALLELV